MTPEPAAAAGGGWLHDPEGVAYPPPPWRLGGTLYASLWLVPREEAPALSGPGSGLAPLILGGRMVIVTGWAVYAPGGVLAYREALCATVLRRPRFPAVTITHIGVDDRASIAGGRALWDIPKEPGQFSGDPQTGARVHTADGRPIAGFRFSAGVAISGRLRFRLRLHTVQPAAGGPTVTALRATGRLRFGRGAWSIAPDGPLGFLHGRRPWLSARLDRATIDFGI